MRPESASDVESTAPCPRRRSAFEHRVPVAREEARPALGVGRLEEADRPAALLGDPADLGDGEVDVPHRDDPERDEAPGIAAAPLVDVPVVVRLEHHAARGPCRADSVNVRALKPAMVGKHIEASTPLAFMSRDPLVDVEASGPQLREGCPG